MEHKHYTLEEMEQYLHRIIMARGNHPLLLAEIMLLQAIEMLRSQSAT
jgi:hypothetical protein